MMYGSTLGTYRIEYFISVHTVCVLEHGRAQECYIGLEVYTCFYSEWDLQLESLDKQILCTV